MRCIDAGLKHIDKILRSLDAPEAHNPAIQVHDPDMGRLSFGDLDVHENLDFCVKSICFQGVIATFITPSR